VVCLNLSGGEFSLCEGNIPKEDALQGRASGPAVIHRSEEVPRKHTSFLGIAAGPIQKNMTSHKCPVSKGGFRHSTHQNNKKEHQSICFAPQLY
jgi:hypothetical protein